MAASCLFVNKAVLIHPSWLSYPHHDRLICIWYDEFLTSSASLLQSLICIWYVEICLCLHPSSESSHDVNQSLAIIYLIDFCHLSLTLHHKDCLYWIWQLVLPIACIWYSNIPRHRFKASLVFLPHHPSAHSLCLEHRLFPPPINVLPSTISTPNHLTNTLHGHDLDFVSVLTFDLDLMLVWLWLSSNSPTLFFVNYLSSELSFSVAMSMYSFFPSSENEINLFLLSMQCQISHLCSYSVLNAMNPRFRCQAICI